MYVCMHACMFVVFTAKEINDDDHSFRGKSKHQPEHEQRRVINRGLVRSCRISGRAACSMHSELTYL